MLKNIRFKREAVNFFKRNIVFSGMFIIIYSLFCSTSAFSESQRERYVDEEHGFEILAPSSWFVHKDAGGTPVFTQSSTSQVKFPRIGIIVESLPYEAMTAFDCSESLVKQYIEMAKQAKAIFKLIEPVTEIKVNGMKGAKFMFNMMAQDGSNSVRYIDCKFVRENYIISIIGISYSGNFNQYINEFEDCINSFRSTANGSEDITNLQDLVKTQLDFIPLEKEKWLLLKNDILSAMRANETFETMFILKDKTEPKGAQNEYISMQWLMKFMSPNNFEIDQSNYKTGENDIWRVVDDKIYIKIGVWMGMPTQGDNDALQGMVKARKEIYKILSYQKYIEMIEKEAPSGIMKDAQDKYTVFQFKPQEIEDLFTGNHKEGKFDCEMFVWGSNKDHRIAFVRTVIEGLDADNKAVKQEYEHFFNNYNYPFKLGIPEMGWMKGK